ncbi:DUF501 domain-containing protein [Actinokineospora globicatena]|uniref:DUF501 domain-containing protein n=1 Tax=Actinokineospora globicatena TaxID=103729 RepID=UPI0020A3F387|nr:DUF501 domain-containing protein [Actinokineospora globicatena]MCP2300614.1 hypothetical protein [Actinokineospora globicatena]GLW81158.1 hypothetical protein Aglo01_56390 [Actinokineospora globicatena]GLW88351.1 hypothetical protein Aglo02_59900 [Actinokineospora globicatena]
MTLTPATEADVATITAHLGRQPRAIRAIAARCPSGHPAVIQTNPRLEDGTPFPTLYYLTCSRLAAAISTVETTGVMREMTDRLADDADLAAWYLRAHQSYLDERNALGDLGTQVTAGGMPGRVKCLHALVAHSLAKGPGTNPFGDEALELLTPHWPSGDCA